ncbi:pentatricopeptide repeat-containing protein At2g27800, mitochondrial-like isoform X1 [Vigna umbellata]|uniref:pentatricopeptide repeat-containing protein At2g27800, mitochondrial-like isoform X1 n=1 Tax=Vigna umbellata TaxID=87088 RepID=UPI001F5FC55A|nr:pentatricopeptide repeat-containing protein At2g27800, mitochondrial-like isoform X1 [Vigna umbellata]XP_047171545.1 pentatricopeptide repeat-containing protein At2g27800, mitochondrial-like isoform X1 [Vigna umbellata]XP_047171546.1 pentatricopeptide repeat-containing protein At2g27800, mitochondrial-like isoform X1 [Vigna umbellata]
MLKNQSMFSLTRNCFKYRTTYFRRNIPSETIRSTLSFCHKFHDPNEKYLLRIVFSHHTHKFERSSFQINSSCTQFPVPFAPFSSPYSTKAPSRSYRRRARNRLLKSSKPTLDQAQFQLALSQLPPRFTTEELCSVIAQQDNPLVCLELFHWASQQPRFRHDVSTFHITIKKLGTAKMFQEMDDIVNQLIAVPLIGSEALFNTVIYYFTQARKLTRAVNVFKHMKSKRNLICCYRPSIRTYNILFAAFLGRGSNSYINHVYMETIRCLFRQMVNDGVKPDIFSLNSMIKGYVLSLHVNDALRIFHQMGVVYDCQPNALTYDYLIHGLCAQGRTNNAKELFNEMKTKGFVPGGKSYNSLVNSLALGGEIGEAVNYLWEMTNKQRSPDFITFRTVLDEICRQRTIQEGMRFLQELQENDLVDGHAYRKLLYVLEDDYGNSVGRNNGIE